MNRLDKELVARGLAPTRAKSQELIKQNKVLINGKLVSKASCCISEDSIIEVMANDTLKYVSRAGLKLDKAIKQFNLDLKGKNIMDIGSSTGGFTDCALQYGANHITAIDVGTNLMHPSLRNNPKITLLEQTNIKNLDSKYFDNIDIITIDVSFISLDKIFEKLFAEQIKVDVIALIKPQFQCGKAIADRYKGVIMNPNIHTEILTNTIESLNSFGYYLLNLSPSPIKGGDGNIEYISLFSNKTTSNKQFNYKQIIQEAFNI